jgi:hypothetical protein
VKLRALEGEWHNAAEVKLRDAHLAVVERGKVLDYLLNDAHPDNGGKAQFFESLGFSRADPRALDDGASGRRRAWRGREGRKIFETGCVEVAVEAARNYRVLRARGHTVCKTIDCLIATFCIRNGHSLLHRDRDFDPFETYLDLLVIHV